MPRPTRALPLVAALLTVLVAPSPPAAACMNGVERVVDTTNQRVRNAESLLAAGKYQRAVKEALEIFPQALRGDHSDARQGLYERAQRIVALAVVRSQGAVKLGPGLAGKTDAERDINLAWAAGMLRLHIARGDGSVVLSEQLAEALAQRPAERHEAHAILKELASGDIMATARGWAVLATLEKSRGDADAAALAVRRCKEVSAEATVCEVVGVS